MRERRRLGLGCIGLPGMLGVFAFLTFASTGGAKGVLIGVLAVVLLYLIIGIAMGQARKRDR